MKYQFRKKAFVLLADGTKFYGKSIGIEGSAFGEICFNTGMTGYQEIFTDPSYFGQIMVTTNTHIGNYGFLESDSQWDRISISGLICKDFSFSYSRPAAERSLFDYLEQHKLVTISDVDTRALVNYIRENGAMNAVISTETEKEEELIEKLQQSPSMVGLELASKVSTKEAYTFGNPEAKYKVAALDLGIKRNILKHMAARDMYLKVFPYDTAFETMEQWNPDGYFISNGPGDPEPLKQVQQVTKTILESGKPLFGICLGHQIIALANDIPTFKMFNGHRGINHPVKNLLTGKGEITSQNHGFAVEMEAAKKHPDFEITHIHLNDQTLAGMRMNTKKCFSVQYHPEAGPGTNDSVYLFDQFKEILTNE
ncbi:MAG: glutamine-hydrolyzing carbamoyl-phosphate synthase small subunit [Flavobacteriaceae bacterium]|jgi:carbamoyl-phosphate synthase small subunit|nr:glutamine-hydrolyzing carbamoyl-phosphate synthase small subunit [Flavobacteriaceae bacterium]